ncbi:major facilitator superfamily domain-containing protein 6-like [Watersipora subatra]|uniref:major facilitator superfamily domain-containing protein 6-like n=1 Tax=Watersipora subatra TaxID=2589382 RepID=UPI00355C22FE
MQCLCNTNPALKKCFHINPQLLTIKIFYFLTLSAIATLIPYLPIFFIQLGIQQTEIAVIYSLIFFLTFFKNAIVGFIADKYQLHKAILIVSCILTGPLYATLLAVPPISKIQPSQVISAQVLCTNASINRTYVHQIEERYFHLFSINQSFPGCQGPPQIEVKVNAKTCIVTCGEGCGSTKNESKILKAAHERSNFTCFSCDIDSCSPRPYSSSTFWLCLIIGIMAALCGSNELMMNDAIALTVLGDDRKMWGLSRLWGSLGYGLASLFVSLLIEKLGDREATHGESIDYTPSFYIYLIISLSNGIVAYFHPTRDGIKSSEVLKGVGKILQDSRVVVFLMIILILGFYNGVMITYTYIYLRAKFMASQLNIGLCVLITVLTEIPIFFFGGRIVEKIGTMACLYIALIAYAVKFLGLVFIPTSWWAVLLETTHTFTFGLTFTAANMHAGKITSNGYTGTMVGLINGIKWGLGLGLGSLLGGYFAEYYKSPDDPTGCQFLFLVSGVSSACLMVFYILFNELVVRFLRMKMRHSKDTQEEQEAASAIFIDAVPLAAEENSELVPSIIHSGETIQIALYHTKFQDVRIN